MPADRSPLDPVMYLQERRRRDARHDDAIGPDSLRFQALETAE
jgi:hypothetical protein